MELTKKQDKLIEKVRNKQPEFADEVDRMMVDQMEDRIVRYTADISEIEKSLENNIAYQALKEQLELFEAPVKESKRVLNDKIKFLVISIEQKGGSTNTNPRA